MMALSFIKKLPIRLFHIWVFIYVVTFFVHLWLGLPIVKSGLWLLIFLIFGLGSLATAMLWKWLPLPLWIVFFLAPFPFTLIMGYSAFANTHQGSPPNNEVVESVASAALNPFFVHISDSHILGPEESRTREGSVRDKTILSKLTNEILRLRPRYLFISGDITDKGKDTEWNVADELLLRPVRDAGIRVILAPGNHDLQPAFLGAPGKTPREAKAILMQRLLERQTSLGSELISMDYGELRTLAGWRPDETVVQKKSHDDWFACVTLGPIGDSNGSWAKGCELATTPEMTRAGLLADYFGPACQDWYPLIHVDHEAHTETIVLCSIASTTSNLGDNAIGAFGPNQLRRYKMALDRIPPDMKQVFVVMHHPVVRRWGESYSVPERWWSWADWSNSVLYNYALLSTEWAEATAVVDMSVEAMQNHQQASFYMIYGHRHQRSLSAIRTEHRTFGLSEAPAFGEEEPGFRACYLEPDTNRLGCKWLKL